MSAETPGHQVDRVFEQPPDAMTCYADIGITVVTETEIILQFYEPTPGPPRPGAPPPMRSRLRATVILQKEHARKIATAVLDALGTVTAK